MIPAKFNNINQTTTTIRYQLFTYCPPQIPYYLFLLPKVETTIPIMSIDNLLNQHFGDAVTSKQPLLYRSGFMPRWEIRQHGLLQSGKKLSIIIVIYF